MAHHSSEESFKSPDLNKLLNELDLKKTTKDGDTLNLGPTGKYPEGKIADNDEGELRMGITTLNGKIVMDFGKPIHTIGFTKEQAIDMANILFERARTL